MNKQLDIKNCNKPWVEAYIHVNGDVKPCCYTQGALGNILDHGSLETLTEGPVAQELRSYVAMNRVHPICANASCVYVHERVSTVADFEGATAWKAAHPYIPEAIPEDLHLSHSIKEYAKIGNCNAMFQVGLALFTAKRFEEAIIWLVAASSARSEFANSQLGAIYWYGNGAKQDIVKAVHHYRLAAATGLASAHTMLGRIALAGHIQDDPATLFREAADKGDPEGWYELSLLHRKKKDEAEADRLLKIAASRGHLKAKEQLGETNMTY